MYACEELFGQIRGEEVQELVQRTTGAAACPCKEGRVCPLLPARKVEVTIRGA